MRAAAAVAALCLAAATAAASPPRAVVTAPIRLEALDLAYDLEFEAADAAIRRALDLDPGDAANHLAHASITWIRLLFRRGALTVDEYLGPPSLADVARPAPPSAEAAVLRAALGRARALAEGRLRTHPNDVDALFAAGAAAGREAAYIATEEGRLLAAYWTSRRAYEAHRMVLALDPSRADAGLIVGTYRYLVATLGRIMRWIAYLAGFDGDKAQALRLLDACASVPNEAGLEARFALVIVFSREGRYDDALRVLAGLRERYPRNRLLYLETGATLLRAGRPAEALRWLDESLARFSQDARPRSFGEDAWWHYKRGVALVQLGRAADARAAADAAAASPAYSWVQGRILTLSGQIFDVQGRRPDALGAYRRARGIAKSTRDHRGVQQAERWIDNPFRGTSASRPRPNQ